MQSADPIAIQTAEGINKVKPAAADLPVEEEPDDDDESLLEAVPFAMTISKDGTEKVTLPVE